MWNESPEKVVLLGGWRGKQRSVLERRSREGGIAYVPGDEDEPGRGRSEGWADHEAALRRRVLRQDRQDRGQEGRRYDEAPLRRRVLPEDRPQGRLPLTERPGPLPPPAHYTRVACGTRSTSTTTWSSATSGTSS